MRYPWGRPTQGVYAKIVLPIKAPDGKQPWVESWITKKLRKRGRTEYRAVTHWVRLAEIGEESADIWSASVDGKHWGCPVYGRVVERTDEKVKVSLDGWAPFPTRVKGTTLPADTGSRRIAVVARRQSLRCSHRRLHQPRLFYGNPSRRGVGRIETEYPKA